MVSSLEKEMVAHSSVLVWRIPGMGHPGGLPCMGSQESDMTEVTQQQQQQHDSICSETSSRLWYGEWMDGPGSKLMLLTVACS